MKPNTAKAISKHNCRLIGFGKIKDGKLILKSRQYDLTGAEAQTIQRTTHSVIIIKLADGTKLATPAQPPHMADSNHRFTQAINGVSRRLQGHADSEQRMSDKEQAQEDADNAVAFRLTIIDETSTQYGYLTASMASRGIIPQMEYAPIHKEVWDMLGEESKGIPGLTLHTVNNTIKGE